MFKILRALSLSLLTLASAAQSAASQTACVPPTYLPEQYRSILIGAGCEATHRSCICNPNFETVDNTPTGSPTGSAIQHCVDLFAARFGSAGGNLSLPNNTYIFRDAVTDNISINIPLRLTTAGLEYNTTSCGTWVNGPNYNPNCAILKAGPNYTFTENAQVCGKTSGLITVSSNGFGGSGIYGQSHDVQIDHLVFDGNKAQRGNLQNYPLNLAAGFNARLVSFSGCTHCNFNFNVVRNNVGGYNQDGNYTSVFQDVLGQVNGNFFYANNGATVTSNWPYFYAPLNARPTLSLDIVSSGAALNNRVLFPIVRTDVIGNQIIDSGDGSLAFVAGENSTLVGSVSGNYLGQNDFTNASSMLQVLTLPDTSNNKDHVFGSFGTNFPADVFHPDPSTTLVVDSNVIDCNMNGSSLRKCPSGMQLGIHPWNNFNTTNLRFVYYRDYARGGLFSNNTIYNARVGINIDGFKDAVVIRNKVAGNTPWYFRFNIAPEPADSIFDGRNWIQEQDTQTGLQSLQMVYGGAYALVGWNSMDTDGCVHGYGSTTPPSMCSGYPNP